MRDSARQNSSVVDFKHRLTRSTVEDSTAGLGQTLHPPREVSPFRWVVRVSSQAVFLSTHAYHVLKDTTGCVASCARKLGCAVGFNAEGKTVVMTQACFADESHWIKCAVRQKDHQFHKNHSLVFLSLNVQLFHSCCLAFMLSMTPRQQSKSHLVWRPHVSFAVWGVPMLDSSRATTSIKNNDDTVSTIHAKNKTIDAVDNICRIFLCAFNAATEESGRYFDSGHQRWPWCFTQGFPGVDPIS